MFASNLARSFQIFFIYLILMSRIIKICNFFNPLPANLSEGRQPPPGQGCLSDGYGSCGFCKACKNVRGVVAFRPFGSGGCQKTDAGGRKVSSRTEKPCPSLISGPAIAGIRPIWEFPNRFLPIPAAAIWRSFWKRDGCRKSRGAPTEDSGGGNG